jgi:hypothetical protein
MKRFEELLEALSYEDLVLLKKDMDAQGLSAKNSIEVKLKKKMREFEKTCTVCSSELRFYNKSNYTLVFGPDDFKKKASFCGLDCVQYFLDHLKSINRHSALPSNESGKVPIDMT